MFNTRQATTAREVGSAHAKLTSLLAARDHWYDGTVASVDARLSAINNALGSVRRVAQNDPEMMAEAQKLAAEASKLHAYKREMLAPTRTPRSLPRVSSLGPRSQAVRRFVATEVRPFLEANADVLGDLEELDTRAQDHAEIATMQMPLTEARNVVSHFRVAVNWSARQAPAPRKVAAAPVDVSFPDDALFD